jgi:hypothetical protein
MSHWLKLDTNQEKDWVNGHSGVHRGPTLKGAHMAIEKDLLDRLLADYKNPED